MKSTTRFIILALALLLIALVLLVATKKEGVEVGFGSSDQAQVDHQGAQGAYLKKRSREASPLTVKALTQRLMQAEDGTFDDVCQSIIAEVSQLDAEQVLIMLDDANVEGGDTNSWIFLTAPLFDALCLIDREAAADYLIRRSSVMADEVLSGRETLLFEAWMNEDPDKFMSWLELHRHEWSESSFVFKQGEVVAISFLAKSDPAVSLERVRSLPPEHAKDVVSDVFDQRAELLAPDQAIDFLREALSGKDHEEVVGRACGIQLYNEGEEAIEAFFQRHQTTKVEGEKILLEAVRMRMGMGLGEEPVDEFHQRMRDFAEAQNLGNANDLTAVILGVMSDRNREDQRAVEALLNYDPEASALKIFLEERGESLDKTQRERITERLKLLSQ